MLKLLIELGPLIAFFWANSKFGVITATGIFMVATLIAMIASRISTGKIPVMLWVSGVVVLVFGGATVLFENELFIKLKPTIIYGLFGAVLFYGIATKRQLLKHVMGASFPELSDEGWRIMTQRWAWFFFVMALLNEIIWRSFSTDTWVASKLFFFMPLSLVFALFQFPLIQRHSTSSLPEQQAPEQQAPEQKP